MKKRNTATRDRSTFVDSDTLLVYSIVPNSVYYTRDELNPSIAKLIISAANTGTTDVTINSFEVELLISGNPEQVLTDVPDRIMPVSAQPDTWNFSAIDPGVYEARPLPGVVIPPKGTVQFELQNVVVNSTAGTTFVTIYELHAGGEGNKTFNISKIRSDLRIDEFRADPATVAAGGTTALSWITTAAASVTLLPGNYSGLKTSDSLQVSVNETTVFTLTAYGTGPSVSSQFTVYVEPVRINSFEALPGNITAGEPVTLTWDTKNASSCSILPGFPELPVNGSQVVYPETNTTYILTARSLAGSSVNEFREVSVTVPPLSIDFFEASPDEVVPEGQVTLRWATKNAVSCSITPDFPEVPVNGSQDVYPLKSTLYVLTAKGKDGISVNGFAQVTTTGPKVCRKVFYDQGTESAQMMVSLNCRNVPVGTVISFRAVQPDTQPPIVLQPTIVTSYNGFTAGVDSFIPAGYQSDIIYCYILPDGVNPPPGFDIRLQVFYIMSPGGTLSEPEAYEV